MKSQWDEAEAGQRGADPLGQRVYSSRLIGAEPDLVLQGGGNTSVKTRITDVFGDSEEVLFVKGSGRDLATIDRDGFVALRLDPLRRIVDLDEMADADMIRFLATARPDPDAPPPSVEAILHAIIPYPFVDHTHADAVVTITNTDKGIERIGQIYGDRMFIVPYMMPGFLLAKEVYTMTRDIHWDQIEGMILLNHGVITFGDDARSSYERMIQVVGEAEQYLEQEAPLAEPQPDIVEENLLGLAALRRAVSGAADAAMIAISNHDTTAIGFSTAADLESIALRGPLTPDHASRTKPTPVIVGENPEEDVAGFVRGYREYFDRNTDGDQTCLDPAPRWAIWRGHGVMCFGRSYREAGVVCEIALHTMRAIQVGEALGGWKPLPEDHVFDVEYWDLQQAKFAPAENRPVLAGKVGIVTGAASGIGRACAETLNEQGAAVVGLDIDPKVTEAFEAPDVWGVVCDVTDPGAVQKAVEAVIRRLGGVDILVSNAGTFPPSATIANLSTDVWQRSLDVNLSAHLHVLRACAPFLELGVDPAVVIVGSKNVPAPGRGAAAYSVAKAGLTQLARVAALELGPLGVRVNTIHPNDVFDTGIWTEEVLESRAAHYGLTVEQYKTRNLMGAEVSSRDVAELACCLAGPIFSKTTGAQIAIDGGSERVI